MSEGKLTMFGKSFATVGSTDTNFLIKTKGDLKVQWGSKFIDIIKNGKIVSQNKELIQTVENSDQISGDGLFIVSEKSQVWVSFKGEKINLTENAENSYVSYIDPQETDSDQKVQALTNIGFYYNSVQEIRNQKIQKGLAFSLEDLSLYKIDNGIVSKYQSSINSIPKIDSLDIGSMKIYEKDGKNYIETSQSISYSCNNIDVMSMSAQETQIKNKLILNGEIANQDSSFRVYKQNEKSILEIDQIIEKNPLSDTSNTEKIFGKLENYIIQAEINQSTIQLTLRFSNQFPNSGNVYICMIDDNWQVSFEKFKIINSIDGSIIIENIIVEKSEELSKYKYNDSKIFQNCKIVYDNNVLIQDQANINLISNDIIHTKIGEVKEEELLKQCPEENEEIPNFGIYSDNFIGLNSILYDPVFKKRCDYPKYDKSIEIPQDPDNEKYKSIIPNIEWIQKLIEIATPKGTIVMFNGVQEIPKGWALCDGTNGTPNLIGKFIKGAKSLSDSGEVPSELSEDNEFILQQKHLPKHSHPHSSHTHKIISEETTGVIGNSGPLTLQSSNYVTDVQISEYQVSINDSQESETINTIQEVSKQNETISGGDHTHSIDINQNISISDAISQEEELEWPNSPIKIEPHSYKLVFIMKL